MTEATPAPQRVIRTDFSTGEVVLAHVWLALAAIFSLLLEIVYLDTVITLPGETMMYFPFTVVIAFLFNLVLTRTAALWVKPGTAPTTASLLSLIPVTVWGVGFFVVLVAGEISGHQWMSANLLPFALLFAGAGGGVWAIARRK